MENKKQYSGIDFEQVSRDIERICNEMATMVKVRSAWRCEVKDKINAYFECDMPWELCNEHITRTWKILCLTLGIDDKDKK